MCVLCKPLCHPALYRKLRTDASEDAANESFLVIQFKSTHMIMQLFSNALFCIYTIHAYIQYIHKISKLQIWTIGILPEQKIKEDGGARKWGRYVKILEIHLTILKTNQLCLPLRWNACDPRRGQAGPSSQSQPPPPSRNLYSHKYDYTII